jgi:hypothetical protein
MTCCSLCSGLYSLLTYIMSDLFMLFIHKSTGSCDFERQDLLIFAAMTAGAGPYRLQPAVSVRSARGPHRTSGVREKAGSHERLGSCYTGLVVMSPSHYILLRLVLSGYALETFTFLATFP